jgi:hyperosmotically inducible periplasmic protein
MSLRHLLSHCIVCLLTVAIVTAQAATSFESSVSSTTGNKKPSAGIPLSTSEKHAADSSDRRIVQTIQRAIENDSFSKHTYNVKVTCQNGIVTLRGRVKTEDEKLDVEGKAADVVGASHVASELAVTSVK